MTTATMSREGLHVIENASRDEIAGLQLERMKWSVRHAYENSPFYRKRFDDHGVHPDDLTTLADLAKFPFTVKQDLRATYPFGMFAVPREKLSRIHGSSGTTGKPTVVGYTARDIDTWATVGSCAQIGKNVSRTDRAERNPALPQPGRDHMPWSKPLPGASGSATGRAFRATLRSW